SHFFAPSIGGVESAVLSLAGGLRKLRTPQGDSEFDVTLVTHTPAGDFDDRSLPFRVVRQPSVLQLWRIIRKSDVIHIAGPALPPLVLGSLARKPVVVEHHGYQAICPNGLMVHQPDGSICPGHFQAANYAKCLRCRASETSGLRSLAELLLMFPRFWLCRRVSTNLAISHHVLERHGLPRSSVVYYGIEDPLGKDTVPSSAANATGKVCFAYVGRFFPEKGIAILLRAAGMLREEGCEFEVRLIGDGPQRPKLEEIIEANCLGSCVRITGYLTGAALADALRDVRVVVMPSVCEETAGLAAIEQMMRGRLVIASRIGGLSEVVGDCGLQFPAGNAEALAECMKRVMQDASTIDSMGLKARERARQLFQRVRMVEEHAIAYREIPRGGSKRLEQN
ncbi:MAG TPA: glycosyltransferase family 4 protein, partial [Candidatus Acidoferrum sp.]|nr:glycosyltransferase family 4 protein [Candidatus Acidoferrum sp.]